MPLLRTLRDIPNYICGFGNSYYDKLEQYFYRTQDLEPIKKSERINAVMLRRRSSRIIRNFASAASAYLIYRAFNQGLDNLTSIAAGFEILRYGSFELELYDRRKFFQKRSESISKLKYEPLEILCEQADQNIKKRSPDTNPDTEL